ncbi:hypothetical protein KC345_g97 [Hortaea werneckii]|nr:hypothetical protein KC345_g97 [Hortaea werneckii]
MSNDVATDHDKNLQSDQLSSQSLPIGLDVQPSILGSEPPQTELTDSSLVTIWQSSLHFSLEIADRFPIRDLDSHLCWSKSLLAAHVQGRSARSVDDRLPLNYACQSPTPVCLCSLLADLKANSLRDPLHPNRMSEGLERPVYSSSLHYGLQEQQHLCFDLCHPISTVIWAVLVAVNFAAGPCRCCSWLLTITCTRLD